eukprot:1176810-Prorocentrum_minimum.AAC.1
MSVGVSTTSYRRIMCGCINKRKILISLRTAGKEPSRECALLCSERGLHSTDAFIPSSNFADLKGVTAKGEMSLEPITLPLYY